MHVISSFENAFVSGFVTYQLKLRILLEEYLSSSDEFISVAARRLLRGISL